MSGDTAEALTPWLQQVIAPLPGEPCGEDPRYDDRFAVLKQEIEKLQGTDYEKVYAASRRMLAEQCKDFRVAGYLILAGVYTRGLTGLTEAARAYRLLAARFWEECHPRRPNARLAALQWLNQGKLEAFARQHGEEGGESQLLQLMEEIGALNAFFREKMGDEATGWTGLNGWLKERLANLQPPPEARSPQGGGASPGPASPAHPSAPASGSAAGGKIGSERELVAATREIRDYLLEKGEYLQAAHYLRALRWGALKSPPHEEGRTRIAPPREAGFREVEKLRSSGDSEGLWRQCENLFLEPGGHLALDLQMLSAEAAEGMGRRELAELLAGETLLLVERCPDLPQLHFEDGRPFADAATRSWLAALAPGTGSAPEKGAEAWRDRLDAALTEGRQSVRQKALPEGLARLRSLQVRTEKERFEAAMASAVLCLEAGREEVALPILEELHERGCGTSLHLWDPALAVELGTHLLEAIRQAAKKVAGPAKSALLEKEFQVRAFVSRIDPVAAVGLI